MSQAHALSDDEASFNAGMHKLPAYVPTISTMLLLLFLLHIQLPS